ncbi:MAG: RNA polymerase-binding protein DksA [Burkholderiales bacterium]|nr:RNA polymerase-binding protein DksA [Burkholderiales bacterium]
MAGKAKAPAKKAAKAPVKKVVKPVAGKSAPSKPAKGKPSKPAKKGPVKATPAGRPAKAAKQVKAAKQDQQDKRSKQSTPVAKSSPAKSSPAKPSPAKPSPAKPSPAKPSPVKAAAVKAAPARPAPARAAGARTAAAPEPAAVTPMPAPKTLPPKPKPASQHDVAAAHEYLLSRSATRSEEPVIVNGKKLPSEEELLKMSEADYMNEDQLAFFRYRLQQMERELLANADETTEHLRETVIVPDPADRATIEEEHALELRTRDRERKLLKKVQQALARIDSGDYGFCEETGDPIGVPRLLARPTATLSLEAQQRREMKQKLYGD